jgi:AraC-like DNA-binding protein
MDPLSDVLELLALQTASSSRLEAGGSWALRFSGQDHLKLGTVAAGHCWLIPEGGSAIHLVAGDCYLLASARPYVAASDPDLEPASSALAIPNPWPMPAYYQTTPDDATRTIVISGSLSFDMNAAELLLAQLPGLVRIPADSDQAATLRPILDLLGEETAGDAPGSTTMRGQLTHVLFIQLVRTLLLRPENSGGIASGWLGALNDHQIGAALKLLHEYPHRQWTVAELAAAVSMSRSSFALRFRTLVGVPPLDYLLRWRMETAALSLRSTDRTVAAIGADAGYASESAFSNAFKRVLGRSPAYYRRVYAGQTTYSENLATRLSSRGPATLVHGGPGK